MIRLLSSGRIEPAVQMLIELDRDDYRYWRKIRVSLGRVETEKTPRRTIEIQAHVVCDVQTDVGVFDIANESGRIISAATTHT